MALENILHKTINKINTKKNILYTAVAATFLALSVPAYSSTPTAPKPDGYSSSASDNVDYNKKNREYHEKQKQDKWHPGYYISKIIDAGVKSSINSITYIKMEISPFGKQNQQDKNSDHPKTNPKPD